MKKISFSCLFCLLCLYSCTYDDAEIDQVLSSSENNSVHQANAFSVHLDDIRMYMTKQSPKGRNGEYGDIQTITYGEDTVMYLINYNEGWEILPGDKRYPLKVAFNEAGNLDFDNMNPAQKMWFDSMAEEIYFMKIYGDTIQNVNCKVWNSLNSKKTIRTRGEIGEGGNWILHNTRVYTDTFQKEHLITTHWEQSYPYNNYCPLTSNGYDHCPAGCTIVAGAQVLNYLHKLWGVPSKTVRNAVYNTATNTYSFSDWTAPWSQVEAGNTNDIALLLGHLGVLSNTNYSSTGSAANLPSGLYQGLSSYGIGCNVTKSWNSSIVYNNINSKRPVIADMYKMLPDGRIGEGHAIVIDGYKSMTTYYTDVYIYVNDLDSYPGDIYGHEEPGNPVPEEGPTKEESYQSVDIYYQINWGWGYWYADDTYYLSSSPIKDIGSQNSYFTYKYAMMHDFYIK